MTAITSEVFSNGHAAEENKEDTKAKRRAAPLASNRGEGKTTSRVSDLGRHHGSGPQAGKPGPNGRAHHGKQEGRRKGNCPKWPLRGKTGDKTRLRTPLEDEDRWGRGTPPKAPGDETATCPEEPQVASEVEGGTDGLPSGHREPLPPC